MWVNKQATCKMSMDIKSTHSLNLHNGISQLYLNLKYLYENAKN